MQVLPRLIVLAALASVAAAAADVKVTVHAADDGPCCTSCAGQKGTKKYFSIVTFPSPACGECCIPPSKFSTYKLFEKNLEPALNVSHPCATNGYPTYEKTETHGIPGILSVTLDMYGKGPAPGPVDHIEQVTLHHIT